MTVHFPKSHTKYRGYTYLEIRKGINIGGTNFSNYYRRLSAANVVIKSAKFTNLDLIFKKQSKVKHMLNRLKNLVVQFIFSIFAVSNK